MKKLAAIMVYLSCCLYNYGSFTAEEFYKTQHHYGYEGETWRDASGFLIIISSLGPISVPVALGTGNFNQHGFRLSPW